MMFGFTDDELDKRLLETKARRFRYVLWIDKMRFYSQPLTREQVLSSWDWATENPNLSALEYESKTEFTPGNYVWKVV